MARKKQPPIYEANGTEMTMAVPKQRRYSVDFEHFENAMLVDANLSYQIYGRDRHDIPEGRRQKIIGILRRFVTELKPELDTHKARIREMDAMKFSPDHSPDPVAAQTDSNRGLQDAVHRAALNGSQA